MDGLMREDSYEASFATKSRMIQNRPDHPGEVRVGMPRRPESRVEAVPEGRPGALAFPSDTRRSSPRNDRIIQEPHP